jgi:hypothetical protein
VVCENDFSVFLDVTWRHIGEGERFGVGVRGSRGTAGINPLHVWKELHGVPTDVAPTGSIGRETLSPHLTGQNGRTSWLASAVRPPPLITRDQITLHRVIDAIYQSAKEGRDVEL